MALSNDLISQFVKVTKDEVDTKKETTVYGTIVEKDGYKYVKLDGSELLTPITSTTDAENNERVTVMIKDHGATVTGNISSPSARTETVKEIGNKITEAEILIANKVDTSVLNAESARIDNLVTENVSIKERLTASEADIDNLEADNVTINEKLTAQSARIESLDTQKLSATDADLKYATITNLNATNTTVHNLEADYGDFKQLTTDNFTAVNADIAGKLTATQADLKYANIDFSNIGIAAIEEFFSKSGMIENIVVGEGTVTGKLVGVTISGDSIEANTIKADKLVVLGSDGLYYKLNVNALGETTASSDPKYQNGLDGSAIIAKSITASKISVTDLVAFDATIGGFHITDSAIYSGVKESVDNTTSGVYLDKNGQFNTGDSINYLKYYKDAENNYKLEVSADLLLLGTSNKDVEAELDNTKADVTNAKDTISSAQVSIDSLNSQIKNLITDENGTSLMTQTTEGWTFNISNMSEAIDSATENITNLKNDSDVIKSDISILQNSVDDLSGLTDYIKIGSYNNQPCLELGEVENDFKTRITNTEIQFIDGDSVPAYIGNKKLNISNAEVTDELQFGGFVWKKRENGNVGLMWKGETE